jgi:hypothetical protein
LPEGKEKQMKPDQPDLTKVKMRPLLIAAIILTIGFPLVFG